MTTKTSEKVMASVRKVKNASIVPSDSENSAENSSTSSEISVQFNSPEVNEQISNALEGRKENMIIQQAEIMQIELFAGDIQEIKGNLGDEYLNAAMLEVAIVNALVDYQERLETLVDDATTKAMQRLAELKNRSAAKSKSKWAEIQSKARENTKAWESVRDFAIEKFDIDSVKL
jgi:hypothetical protein